jgi:capsular exopolysaccharide synthesis family protein
MEQDMVRLLRERVQSASLDLISGRSPIEVIEPASPGTVRMAMSWSRIVAMGILAGMLLGAVAGLALDQIRPRIDHVADVAKRLTVPVIGTISRRSRVLFGQDASEDELEHYRMLRNSIEFADEGFRSLCIAGAGSGEGRTLAALNLAWVWAEQGARVLLVDAHRRRPALHHQLGVVNNGGLSDCLTSRRSIDKFVQHTSMPNLSILTAGVGGVRGRPITPDLVDEIHEWARERVDLVIFDTPPLTRSSDAGVVARFSDAVVLVVRRDAHAAAVHQRAVSLLVASNCNVLGAIVNGSVGAQFELSHPGMRRSLPYRVVREQTLHDRVTRNSRKAA